MRQQHRHHRAQQIGHGGAGGLQAVEIAAGGKAFVAHDGCARHQRLKAGVQCVGMEQRQAGVEHVRIGDLQIAGRDPAPPVELRMRAAHAFGQPRGARGVQNGQHVAGPDVGGGRQGRIGWRRRRTGRRRQAIDRRGLVQQPDRPQAQRVCRFCGGHGGQRRQGRTGRRIRHQQHAAAIGQDVPQLHAAGRRIDGHHHRAQPTAAQDDGQEFVPVAGHQADTVATPDACRGQARGPACGVGWRIAEAQSPTRRLHPQAIAQTGALLHQQRRQCQRMHGDASPVVRPLPGVARLYGISLGINYLCVKFMGIIYLINQTDIKGMRGLRLESHAGFPDRAA